MYLKPSLTLHSNSPSWTNVCIDNMTCIVALPLSLAVKTTITYCCLAIRSTEKHLYLVKC